MAHFDWYMILDEFKARYNTTAMVFLLRYQFELFDLTVVKTSMFGQLQTPFQWHVHQELRKTLDII